jgi:6-phosphofructo-2-kinase / fructose-2,6-biphosphatase 2
MRELAAQEAFNDILKWYAEKGVVAILDATNSNKKRREWIVSKCKEKGIRLMFVESICDNEELVLSNILDVKVSSPDYIGQDPEHVSFPIPGSQELIGSRLHWIFNIDLGYMRNIMRLLMRLL